MNLMGTPQTFDQLGFKSGIGGMLQVHADVVSVRSVTDVTPTGRLRQLFEGLLFPSNRRQLQNSQIAVEYEVHFQNLTAATEGVRILSGSAADIQAGLTAAGFSATVTSVATPSLDAQAFAAARGDRAHG